ncbi:MAG: hypothetical protein K8S87_07240, partial [Planctomycetes bacterium]|nr:hypothetical protein [Planctomycetota bacterium]
LRSGNVSVLTGKMPVLPFYRIQEIFSTNPTDSVKFARGRKKNACLHAWIATSVALLSPRNDCGLFSGTNVFFVRKT